MAFANSGDPKINPKEGGFENLPAGAYKISGIADYFSKDEQELPIFKPTQNELKAHCHFSIADGSKGLPAWSGTKEGYYNLAKALGASVEGLEVESTTEFLLEIQKRINAAGVSTEVRVGDKGWVNKINALLPPKGIYKLAFREAYSLDKTTPITFQEKENRFDPERPNYVVRFRFEIVSDSEGGVEYAGNSFLVEVHNPFEGVFNNVPAWKRAKNGGMLNAQRRLMTFMNIYWPEVEDYRWVVDPEESEYGINEADNPIVVIVDKCKNSGRLAMAPIDVTETGYIKMDLLDLCPTKGSSVTGVTPIAGDKVAPWGNTVDAGVYTSTFKVHQQLVDTIEKFASGDGYSPVFAPTPENPYAFTTKGGEWCKMNVAPVWDGMNLGAKRNFSVLSDAQAAMLEGALRSKLGPAMIAEEEDTDF